MLATVVLVGGIVGTAKAVTLSLAAFIRFVDDRLNEKGAFKCEIELLGAKLNLDHQSDRKIAQTFFNACKVGSAVELLPEARFIRMYLYANAILNGTSVTNLPVEYFQDYPEYRKLFLIETKKIWIANQNSIYPFGNILKKNKAIFTLPPTSDFQ